MAQSTQGNTVTIKILLNDLGDLLRYEIDQVTLAEGKMPENDETAAQPHFDCLQCRSRYFISPTIIKMATQVVEIKEEPELDLFDVEKVEEIKSEDFDDRDVVEIELISSTLDNVELDQNVNELSIKTEPSEEKANSPFKEEFFTCSECPKKFREKSYLTKHKRNMHQKEFRKCMVCSWSRKCTIIEFKHHLRRQHPSIQSKEFRLDMQDHNRVDYPCVYCKDQKVFKSFKELKQHLFSHKRYYMCETCPKAYTCRAHLEKHFKLVHEKKSLYQCEKCNWTRERTKAEYHSHLRRSHSKLKKSLPNKSPEVDDFNGVDYPCVFCEDEKIFKSFDELKDHLKSSHKKIYPCETCPRAYTARAHLEKHFKLVHEKKSLYQCEICNWTRECTKAEYHSHLRRTHLKLKNNREVKDFNGVEYPCIYCEDHRVFKSFDKLRQHLRAHRKLYVCKICPKAYSARAHLEKHFNLTHKKKIFNGTKSNELDHLKLKPVVPLVRIDSTIKMIGLHKKKTNTDEKPFICGICDAKFRWKNNLAAHMNIHLNIRYTCDECPKSFATKSYLRVHKRISHQDSAKTS